MKRVFSQREQRRRVRSVSPENIASEKFRLHLSLPFPTFPSRHLHSLLVGHEEKALRECRAVDDVTPDSVRDRAYAEVRLELREKNVKNAVITRSFRNISTLFPIKSSLSMSPRYTLDRLKFSLFQKTPVARERTSDSSGAEAQWTETGINARCTALLSVWRLTIVGL